MPDGPSTEQNVSTQIDVNEFYVLLANGASIFRSVEPQGQWGGFLSENRCFELLHDSLSRKNRFPYEKRNCHQTQIQLEKVAVNKFGQVLRIC